MILTRRRSLVAMGFLFMVPTLAGTGQAECRADFVTVKANVISVIPGGNDTENLQCAFDLAATRGSAISVELGQGVFYTDQLVIGAFRGRVVGKGTEKTILHTPDHPLPIDRPCEVGGLCFVDAPPSVDNRYPSLVSILGGDLTISDLSFVAAGGYGTQLWHFWGMRLGILSNIVEVLGSETALRVERVAFDAGGIAWSDDFGGFVGDSAGGLIAWSFVQPVYLQNTSITVTESSFTGEPSVSGFFAYNLERGRVQVRGNRFDVSPALALSDLRDSVVLFEHNEVATPAGQGVFLWPGNLGSGISASKLWFGNNTFAGLMAISAAPGTFAHVKCEAVNNDVSGASTPFSLNGNDCKIVPK